MAEVLIIDNTQASRELIQTALGSRFFCTSVASLKEAISVLSNIEFDAILVETSLENESGYDLFKRLPSTLKTKNTPIFLISQSHAVSDKVQGFALGAADFITKPFNPEELKARIESKIVKLQALPDPNSLKKDGLIINLELQRLYLDTKSEPEDLKLTGYEFKIFYQLFKNKGRPIKREELYQALQLQPSSSSSRKIDAHVSNLRKKLKSKSYIIKSLYGVGYIYRP